MNGKPHAGAPVLAGPPATVLWLLAILALAGDVTFLFSRRAKHSRSYPARLARGRELAPATRPET